MGTLRCKVLRNNQCETSSTPTEVAYFGQVCTTVARTGSFGGIVLALGENRGARVAVMKFRLTFICREPGCDKTAVVLYDAPPGETVQQFRQRNPIFLAVLCGAKHAGNYPASTAVDITVPAQRTKSTA